MRKDIDTAPTSARIQRLKQEVQTAVPGICTERTKIWTDYFRRRKNRRKSIYIQMAEALSEVLERKTIRIYRDELLVGNFTSKRVGGSIFPELHGLVVMQDLFKFSSRATSPLEISGREIRSLLRLVPFWLFRFLGIKTYSSLPRKLRFLVEQLKGHYYLINESGGIGHLVVDYARLAATGTEGLVREAETHQKKFASDSEQWFFLEGVKIIAEGLARFSERYAVLARSMAEQEPDEGYKQELLDIARTCESVPRHPATNFREAMQTVLLAQIAINLESLDEGNSPGRMDHYLYPYYRKDVETGKLTRQQAKELAAAFCIKLSEIVPVFSERITRFHGGMFNGQVITVGGTDSAGKDSSNDLSYIFLELMDELRMRQPNFHARLHNDAPKEYLDNLYYTLCRGSNSPALYNDEVMVETMVKNGYSLEDARNYTATGCVEPVSQGKSLSSTDAALFNVPVMLELALNQGKRFSSLLRKGEKTKAVSQMTSMEDVLEAFEAQLSLAIGRLIADLHAVERANARYHPTPFSSMLLAGCLENGICSTAGGAAYNFSGIQCTGPADTGDALYAIEQAVFVEKKISLPRLVNLLKNNLKDETWRNYLRNLPKFGNDFEPVDKYTRYVTETFAEKISAYTNTRGGAFTTGLYSVTSHQFYGEVTGALPNGRRKGEPFASGIAPANGMDKSGPTALLNSMNRLDFTRYANGINLNLKFDASLMQSETGQRALQSMLGTYFRRGGMQVQINVMDKNLLKEARDNPHAYPNLLVRVSGYSAYFNDLSRHMQDELINRSHN